MNRQITMNRGGGGLGGNGGAGNFGNLVDAPALRSALRVRYATGILRSRIVTSPEDLAPEISALMDRAEQGDSGAAAALFEALYSELHRLSQRELARQGGLLTLSATTLLHEAYLDMAGRRGTSFPDRARFMGYAARVMRNLIVDYARARRAQKRGGQFEITSLGPAAEHVVDDRQLTTISEALEELAKIDRAAAEVVDFKFFCGLSFAEIGALQNASERTVERRWAKARIYLRRALRARSDDSSL